MPVPPSDPVLAPWRLELRACLALSWPLVLTNAIEMAMNLTNSAMIARLSPEALAASTLALAFHNVCLLFGIGVTAAIAPLIAREVGRGGGAGPAVRRIVQQGLWGAMIVAGPISLILWNVRPILRACGQDPALVEGATRYLHALQWSLIPALAYLVLRSFFAAMERPRLPVVTGVAAVALNAVLNWLLIGGHGPLPALGLFGSGLATLLSNAFMAGALALIAAFHPRFRALRLFGGLHRPDWRGFGAFWSLGLPIGASLVLETGMFAVAAVMIGRFDAASLAAHAIALQAASFTFMVPLGVAQAATVRIGRAFGAGDRAAIARSGWTALGVGMATMVVSAALFVLAPHAVIALFLGGDEPGAAGVEAVATTLLGLAALFQLADGAQVVLSGMLRGLGDTRAPMVTAVIGYWGIGLPLGATLAFAAGLRAPGVWMGLTAGLFSVAILLLARWRNRLEPPAPALVSRTA